jgi:hypothetical protein
MVNVPFLFSVAQMVRAEPDTCVDGITSVYFGKCDDGTNIISISLPECERPQCSDVRSLHQFVHDGYTK